MPIQKDSCMYQSHYCEENIYQLLKKNESDSAYAVIVSNQRRIVRCARQAACRPGEEFVFWDYHVFAIFKDEEMAYDLDCTISFPVNVKQYLETTFQLPQDPEYELIAPRFRLTPRKTFLAHFSSDRSHMINKATGEYMMPPPTWEPPNRHQKPNFEQFIDMETELFDSQIMDYNQLLAFCTGK